MTDTPHPSTARAGVDIESFPTGLPPASRVLVACHGTPAQHAVGLAALCEYGHADDTAVVVTTTEGIERTIETYDACCGAPERPTLGVVDTTSEQQSMSALYGETPVVFTPSPGDLERLVVALSELTDTQAPPNGTRHLVLRSLTPILETTATDHVCTVLERITGLRSGRGFCLLGVDYTAHDEATMRRIVEEVDGILWVTPASTGDVDLEYCPARGRHTHALAGGDGDD